MVRTAFSVRLKFSDCKYCGAATVRVAGMLVEWTLRMYLGTPVVLSPLHVGELLRSFDVELAIG